MNTNVCIRIRWLIISVKLLKCQGVVNVCRHEISAKDRLELMSDRHDTLVLAKLLAAKKLLPEACA